VASNITLQLIISHFHNITTQLSTSYPTHNHHGICYRTVSTYMPFIGNKTILLSEFIDLTLAMRPLLPRRP
jgi:hypothetical protein